MKKNYQKTTAPAGTSDGLVLPDAVTVTMAAIGGAVNYGSPDPRVGGVRGVGPVVAG